MKSNLGSSLKAYALWALVLTILFPVIYATTNSLSLQAVRTFRFAHDLELAIPFVPMALLIYMTLQILFILPVFFLNAPAINRLGKALTLSLLVAAPIFYFLPAPIIYERQIPEG